MSTEPISAEMAFISTTLLNQLVKTEKSATFPHIGDSVILPGSDVYDILEDWEISGERGEPHFVELLKLHAELPIPAPTLIQFFSKG